MNGIQASPITRVNSLPDPAFQQLEPLLTERLERLASSVRPEQFGSLLSPLMRALLEKGFTEATADEGTVWLLDQARENLVPAYNTGPQANQLVGHFKQPLNAGLICMVFASEQPFIENEVWKNSRQSKLLDGHLRVQTWSMIAVPLYFIKGCRGVISCVQLAKTGGQEQSRGFAPQHLASVQLAAALLSRLTEFELLSRIVGWNSE